MKLGSETRAKQSQRTAGRLREVLWNIGTSYLLTGKECLEIGFVARLVVNRGR